MLALIVRFVGRDGDASSSDQAFLNDQVAAMQAYVEQFQEADRETRAIEWIEQYAREYRRSWQRRHVSNWLKSQHCPDCPLRHQQQARYCEIHGRWSGLLNHYLADAISTREYVEKALLLLTRHKSRLQKSRADYAVATLS